MRIETYHCDLPAERKKAMRTALRKGVSNRAFNDYVEDDLSADAIIESIWNAGMKQ